MPRITMLKSRPSPASGVPDGVSLEALIVQDSLRYAGAGQRQAPGGQSAALKGCLEDLLGDLWHARRSGDLGRLALLLYCEVRRWARLAGEQHLAESSSVLMTDTPHSSRDEFLAQVDRLIAELEAIHARPG